MKKNYYCIALICFLGFLGCYQTESTADQNRIVILYDQSLSGFSSETGPLEFYDFFDKHIYQTLQKADSQMGLLADVHTITSSSDTKQTRLKSILDVKNRNHEETKGLNSYYFKKYVVKKVSKFRINLARELKKLPRANESDILTAVHLVSQHLRNPIRDQILFVWSDLINEKPAYDFSRRYPFPAGNNIDERAEIVKAILENFTINAKEIKLPGVKVIIGHPGVITRDKAKQFPQIKMFWADLFYLAGADYVEIEGAPQENVFRK